MSSVVNSEHGYLPPNRFARGGVPQEIQSGAVWLGVRSSEVPAVSVVIPTYNAATFVREAIQSALDQTYQDLEIIVIDDGSSDKTESVVGSFGEAVRYVKQENQGAGAARNRGIAMARGRYVAFLDADDLWLPQKLAEQVPLLDADPELGLVHSDWAVVSEKGPKEPSYLSRLPTASGYIFDELAQCGFILTSCTVVRRSCLENIDWFDETLSIAQDYDLWLRICYRWKTALVDKPLVTKRNRDGNLSSDFTKTAVEKIALFKKTLHDFSDMTPHRQRLLRRQLAQNYWDVGYHYFDRLMLKEARRNFVSSIGYDWRNGKAYGHLAASCLPVPILRVVRTAKRAWS